jgi:hypothetical protein
MWQTILGVLRQSWQQFELQLLGVAPNVLAGLFILGTGILVGWIAARAIQYALTGAQFDRHAARLGVASWLHARAFSPAALVARAVKWTIVLMAGSLALYSLAPRVVAELTFRFLAYAPDMVAGGVILVIGAVASRFLSRSVLIAAVNEEMRSPHLLSGLTRAAILTITAAAALEQLGIARMTVLAAFAILLGGATLAAALAVGLGCQEHVRRWLSERSTARPRDDHYQIRHW